MGPIQSGINQLLTTAAIASRDFSYNKAKKAKTEAQKKETEFKESMRGIAKNTAEEKLKNIRLRNESLMYKNKALQNMQEKGNAMVGQKETFEDFKKQLMAGGVAEKAITANEEFIKKQWEAQNK